MGGPQVAAVPGPETMRGAFSFLRLLALVVGVGVVSAALWADREVALGVGIGGALCVANVWMLTRIAWRVVRSGGTSAAPLLARIFAKYAILAGAFAFFLFAIEVNRLGFFLGLSSLFPAALLQAVLGGPSGDSP